MKWNLLKDKNFVLLQTGRAVSMIGSDMQQFVLALYVLARTGSAVMFASMVSIAILPRLLLAPVAGVFADWFNRKKTIVRVDFINGIIIGIFSIIYAVNGELTIPMIYVLVVVLEITEIFFGSAMAGIVPSIVKKEDLAQANSISSLISSVATFIAPMIAGVIYVAIGMQLILIINAISFILSAISEMFIDVPKNHKKPEKINLNSFKIDFVEGIKIIKGNKMISTMISLGTIINFCMSPVFTIGVTYILIKKIEVSEMMLGYMHSTMALSMIAAPIIFGTIFSKFKIGRLSYRTFITIAILIFILGIVPSPIFMNLFNSKIIAFICIAIICSLIAIAATIINIGLSTLFQKVTPIEYMGRTSTVFGLGVTAAMPLGYLFFAYLYDKFPPYIATSVAGVILGVSILSYRKALLEADNDMEDGTIVESSEVYE